MHRSSLTCATTKPTTNARSPTCARLTGPDAYVDQEVFQIRKVEFFDRRGDLLKVLQLDDYRQYDNGVWRAHKLSMENMQTNKQTDLVYQDYTFNVGVSNKDFVKGRLSRLR